MKVNTKYLLIGGYEEDNGETSISFMLDGKVVPPEAIGVRQRAIFIALSQAMAETIEKCLIDEMCDTMTASKANLN